MLNPAAAPAIKIARSRVPSVAASLKFSSPLTREAREHLAWKTRSFL
jgi:hypothetical protein